MNMKITCLKCESEYIVDINSKRFYCSICDIDYIITSVELFVCPNQAVKTISKYKSINNKYNFDGEQVYYL